MARQLPPDLSLWGKRDADRRRRTQAVLASVEAALPAVREFLTQHWVRETYLFGSLASGAARPDSDVDIAVSGCPPAELYRMSAKLERAFGLPLDVVDLDLVPEPVAVEIREHGRRIYP